ncbi:MAG: M28 family peptidase [Bryobacterales bacterium]|nr:M28 family peptidase [Bryobacterales bacterium]
MLRAQAILMLAAGAAAVAPANGEEAPRKPAATPAFSGARALEFTRAAVSFGPRPPGSAALGKLRAYILAQLKTLGCETTEDAFTATTPRGPVSMRNLIARFPGRSGRAVVFSGHYDTKWFPDMRFVGANDGGSSTGFLLEMARTLSGRPRVDDVYLVWFDGEEAFGEWSESDGIYGSRHLAARWAAEGKLSRVKALINVDMIGDRSLGILQDLHSTEWLRTLVWRTAARLGLGFYFNQTAAAIEDDHLPFLRRGVSALDLIDFDYPPWHTEHDTMDKLSARSLEVVGTVLLEVLQQLEAKGTD